MPNGGGPPDRVLSNADYNIIKNGVCIVGGTYDGCIKVNSTHYWVTPEDDDWLLKSDPPEEESICKISSDIWDKCKNGGEYTWSSKNEYWTYSGANFRWAALEGKPIELKQIA